MLVTAVNFLLCIFVKRQTAKLWCFQPDWSQSNCIVYTNLEDVASCELYVTGGNDVEIKTEADSDMTECQHDEQPSTSRFFLLTLQKSSIIYSILLYSVIIS